MYETVTDVNGKCLLFFVKSKKGAIRRLSDKTGYYIVIQITYQRAMISIFMMLLDPNYVVTNGLRINEDKF